MAIHTSSNLDAAIERDRQELTPELATADQDRAFVAVKIPLRLIGIAMLTFVVILLAAYSSWSVDDPSLSYATNKVAQNWLGYPGAVLADIGMQFFGLAALIALIPPTIWGWGMVNKATPPNWMFRLLTWGGSALLASGVMSCITAPDTWPLPTGLGGLAGSAFTALAHTVAGQAPSGAGSVLFALVLLAPTLALLWISSGISVLRAPGDKQAEPETSGSDNTVYQEQAGPVDIVFGGLMHLGLTLKNAWRRASQRVRDRASQAAEQDERPWQQSAIEPTLQTDETTNTELMRHEPLLGAGQHDGAQSASWQSSQDVPPPHDWAPEHADTATHLEDYYPVEPVDTPAQPHSAHAVSAPTPAPAQTAPAAHGEDKQARQSVEQSAARAASQSALVATPAATVKPGQRLAHEAQGSLLAKDGFQLPELTLLAEPQASQMSPELQPAMLEQRARQLEGVLEDFGVKGDIINVRPGPVVTLYELEPAPGIKSSRVISLADDIARSMSAVSARVAVVPGRNAIGIELPNSKRETVFLREMLASSDFEKSKAKLPICLGKTIGGEPIIVDLARMPHLLIAGTTGSGKSVAINTMILSLLYRMTPEQCRVIMIDPKVLELSIYDGIPHLLSPVVTDPSKAVTALKWAVREMEDRYRKMSKIGVRNIDGFNKRVREADRKGDTITRTVQTGFNRETGEAIYESETFELEPLPFIVIIVDEMADLMMVAGKDIEGAIQRLAQMARAAGIHLVMATQRPSVDVITGTIKANFPTRISFQVTSKIDSRTILGEQGAEQLLGMGDMLYMAGGGRIKRLHGPFVGDQEVEDIVSHLKAQGTPDYLESVTEEGEEADPSSNLGNSGDELYDKAVNIVLNDRKASTSYIQRRLSIGYNRAATLIERLEAEGVISAANHAGKREILVGDGVD